MDQFQGAKKKESRSLKGSLGNIYASQRDSKTSLFKILVSNTIYYLPSTNNFKHSKIILNASLRILQKETTIWGYLWHDQPPLLGFLLGPSDTEEQTEMFVSLSLFIERQTVFPFFHTPNYICHLIFSCLLRLNRFLRIRQFTSVKGHSGSVENYLFDL